MINTGLLFESLILYQIWSKVLVFYFYVGIHGKIIMSLFLHLLNNCLIIVL
jgi:hypothetical protein